MDESGFRKKNEIRSEVKILKTGISDYEKKRKSEKIFSEIENLDIFKNAYTIFIYWSLSDEVQTHDFIGKWENEKKFFLPVVINDYLELREFKGRKNLVKGKAFNIQEPTGEAFIHFNSIDLVIVPGVAFDKSNNRLGHGKAFYDKLLPKLKAPKIGVCFDFQLMETIPVTETDIKMDLVISD